MVGYFLKAKASIIKVGETFLKSSWQSYYIRIFERDIVTIAFIPQALLSYARYRKLTTPSQLRIYFRQHAQTTEFIFSAIAFTLKPALALLILP
jgi:hypothetical protein